MAVSDDTQSSLPKEKRQKKSTFKCKGVIDSDDEIMQKQSFDVKPRVHSTPDDESFYECLQGHEVNLAYFQKNGFSKPILVKDKTGLGLRMPSQNFTVSDVKKCVGSWRMVDVVDVSTQSDLEMSMRDWCAYYEGDKRDRLLNVISLEFSHTKLDHYVHMPSVVNDMDWVGVAWPLALRELQKDSTNFLNHMMYPKVQKYCLMSVADCYTDFHIDMGGTSVWYHILKGSKVFWFIEPTAENLQAYEKWTLSSQQGSTFFGDLVPNCYKITLKAGYTFFIPPGWIHAVHTPEDSLVFGGNFLHSFNIPMQLTIYHVETSTHVPMKFRYPFYLELHWYLIERYLATCTNKQYLTKIEEGSSDTTAQDDTPAEEGKMNEEIKNEVSEEMPLKAEKVVETEGAIVKRVRQNNDESLKLNDKAFLVTKHEYTGLKMVADWLFKMPLNKRKVPLSISQPDHLLRDFKMMLSMMADCDFKNSITGIPFIQPALLKKTKILSLKRGLKGTPSTSNRDKNKKFTMNWNYRRVRCRKCEPCTREDCKECYACVDMKKYGGDGVIKKPCLSRQCMQPILPASAICFICKQSKIQESQDPPQTSSQGAEVVPQSDLLECTICFQVHHLACLQNQLGDALTDKGVIDEDYPSSWECSKCCSEGKKGQGRSRFRPPLTEPTKRRKSMKNDD